MCALLSIFPSAVGMITRKPPSHSAAGSICRSLRRPQTWGGNRHTAWVLLLDGFCHLDAAGEQGTQEWMLCRIDPVSMQRQGGSQGALRFLGSLGLPEEVGHLFQASAIARAWLC